MKILAFDTSNGALSIALLENNKLLDFIEMQENGKQAEMLIPLIEDILRRNKIWYNSLDLIATTKGPGSFTGVRIGLSCAKSIKLAANLPLALIDSLHAIAYKHKVQEGKILATIDAKMDEFFIAEFSSDGNNLIRLTESRLVNKKEFDIIAAKHNFICGTTQDSNQVAKADSIGLIAYEEFLAGAKFTEKNPFYLRQPKIGERKNNPKRSACSAK